MDINNMTTALTFMKSVITKAWEGLDSVNVPILGVSFTVFFLAMIVFNWSLKLYSTVTGGSQDKNPVQPGLDNNNHYIYRR